jgi:2-iminobutanoate/2-iminopropanoate deaminase
MKNSIAALLLGCVALSGFASHTVIATPDAPTAIGPYSQAIASEKGLVFVSGQIPIDPKTGLLELFEGDAQKQTELVLSNINAILDAAGCDKSDVMKSTVYLTKISDFPAMNIPYAEFFGDHKPARSTIAAADLPKGAPLEIEVIALCKR